MFITIEVSSNVTMLLKIIAPDVHKHGAVSGHRAAMAQLINAGKTPYVVQTV